MRKNFKCTASDQKYHETLQVVDTTVSLVDLQRILADLTSYQVAAARVRLIYAITEDHAQVAMLLKKAISEAAYRSAQQNAAEAVE